MKPSNWRHCPLTAGVVYTALKDIPSLLESIQSGNQLEFERMEYSPYDGMSIIIFQTLQDGRRSSIRWTLFDNAPEPDWGSLFAETPDSPPNGRRD